MQLYAKKKYNAMNMTANGEFCLANSNSSALALALESFMFKSQQEILTLF
jgi:hypothetical protein